MAKKKVAEQIYTGVEKVYSNKYQCLLTKSTSYYDEDLKDWLNVKIEENLKRKK